MLSHLLGDIEMEQSKWRYLRVISQAKWVADEVCVFKSDYFCIRSDVRRDCNMTGHILSKLAKDLKPR